MTSKQSIFTIIFLNLFIAFAYPIETKFLKGYEIVRSKVNTETAEDGLSLILSKIAYQQDKKTQIGTTADSLDLDSAYTDADLSQFGIEGQFAYDNNNDFIIFSKKGVLYFSQKDKNGKWVQEKELRIKGIGKQRITMRGSSMFYRSWRYPVEKEVVVYNPHFSQDNQKLYYSSNYDNTLGGLDIWYSKRESPDGEKWGEPQNLGKEVNSENEEDYPFIAAGSLYFSSNRKDTLNGTNIYKHPMNGGVSKLIPEPINSNADDYNFIGTKESIYLISNRDGNTDIYYPFKKDSVLTQTQNPNPDTTTVDSIKEPEEEPVPKLVMPDVNTCILYFIFDQDNFITDYSAEIDTILKFIDFHEGANFEIIGHTDERGTVEYNQGLSERRANKLYRILIRRGVAAKRMETIGRSELELAIPNAKTKREHQLNRRVVIRKKE